MIQAPSPAPVLVLVKASLPLPGTQHLGILTTPVSVYTAPAREGSISSSQRASWNSTEYWENSFRISSQNLLNRRKSSPNEKKKKNT